MPLSTTSRMTSSPTVKTTRTRVASRVLADVGQHFAQYRQHMIGRLLRNCVVDGALKLEVRTHADRRGKLVHKTHDSLTETTGQRAIAEFENRGSDFGDGGVKVVYHFVDPLPYEVEIGKSGGTLKGHPDRKQALHHLVVEVATDPLSVIEDTHRTNALVQAVVVDRDAGSQSECFRKGFVLLGEVVRPDLVREIQIAEDFTSRPDRHSEKGLHWWMVRGEPVAQFMRAEFAHIEGAWGR